MNVLVELFQTIVSMASTASVVIGLVLLLRLLLKKASRKLVYGLWAIVALRLLIPVMLPSNISLFNILDHTSHTNAHTVTQYTGSSSHDATLNPNTLPVAPSPAAKPQTAITNADTANIADSLIISDITVTVFNYDIRLPGWTVGVWLGGIVLFCSYFVLANYNLARKLRFATLTKDNIYYCEEISSPFVFGVKKPRIYLPYGLQGTPMELILQHEQYHIRQKDHLAKMLAFALLSIYWFCPTVWISYYYSMKDMELRCDEAVLTNASLETRKCYSSTLLAFAGNNRHYLPSPIAFSENGIRQRIHFALTTRKKSVALTILSIIAIIITGILCLTDKKSEAKEGTDNQLVADNPLEKPFSTETDTGESQNSMSDSMISPSFTLGTYTAQDKLFSYISIDKNQIAYGSLLSSHLELPKKYTVEGDIIYLKNAYDETGKTIKIIDSLTLEMDGVIYKLEQDSADSSTEQETLDVQAYITALTDNDITSATSVAKNYYDSITYVEKIMDIRLCESSYEYENRIPVGTIPGNVIVLEAVDVWSGNYKGIRYIVLTRENATSEWIFHSEGL